MIGARQLAAALACVALSLGGAGCTDEHHDGSVTVTLTAHGAGIGKTGNVIVQMWDPSGARPETFEDGSLASQTLAANETLQVPRFERVPPGTWRVLAYLDVDGSQTLNAGDVYWGGHVTVDVDVDPGADVPVTLDLDTVY